MEIEEYLKYRNELLIESQDSEGFINESSFINCVMPILLDSKLVDSEDYTETYFSTDIENQILKINGYLINDSGERLQIFILNEESISNNCTNLEINLKDYYDNIFKQATNFVNKSIKGHLNKIQDVGAINALINQMSSSIGADQFDVIEIFLITATVTVETRGQKIQPKKIDFKDDFLKIKYSKERNQVEKDILIVKRLIDMNYLYNIMISQSNSETLVVDFEERFGYKMEAIRAANEQHFESYLCVFPATTLAQLYLKESSRLLEKNVRSFLQFRGANLGMKKTIDKAPEKFIAFNNGLTITASNVISEEIDNKIYIKSLTDFQIVNGGQTTASIYFSHKEGLDISKVKIMAKINVAKNVSEEELNDLITDISKFSNSQTKVTNVDLDSRNLQLSKIKSLSDSIVTPSGHKWFFEKSKGEFITKLRIAGEKNKNHIEKQYPKEYRFTKEQLGKYYCSWGNEPYKVKKGGEAIFRKFIEEISSNDKKIRIDRYFYENLISKIILFKALEDLHGVRNEAIGQLRSAVVPYTISIIYSLTDGNKKSSNAFNLMKLWTSEGLEEDLAIYLKSLMSLINQLIKKYAKSDDLGEYSKKKELWEDILSSNEILDFTNNSDSKKILDKYTISKKELEKLTKNKLIEINFDHIIANVEIFKNTEKYYEEINLKYDELNDSRYKLLNSIINSIKKNLEISDVLISFEKKLIYEIRMNKPELFDNMKIEPNYSYTKTLDFIINKYNKAVQLNDDIESVFKRIEQQAILSNSLYYIVYNTIGKQLKEGIPPTIHQIIQASEYIMKINNVRK
jgi:hypothetical protein